nr:unnamed protein product [Callosobruchus chinensis]
MKWLKIPQCYEYSSIAFTMKLLQSSTPAHLKEKLVTRRPLKLHKLLEELVHPDRITVPPDGVIFFPPKTANDDFTYCDSGDEEFTTMAANGQMMRPSWKLV